jgi:hypothetical protein
VRGRLNPVCLASWKEEEGRARKTVLEDLGFEVDFHATDAGRLLRKLIQDQPFAIVIDLSRSPAQGRDLGVALRVQASTRLIPLVFAGGAPEKVEAIRKVLPDAAFGSWDDIGPTLRQILDNPPADPVVPESMLAGYSGTPLPKKLGIKSSYRVLLVGSPPDFPDTLGPLPENARLVTRFGPSVDLILWFVKTRRELERDLARWAPRVPKGGMWMIWPKKSSGVESDLHQNLVRQTGLGAGLVDYKIAAVDATWSGLKFAVRKNPKGS